MIRNAPRLRLGLVLVAILVLNVSSLKAAVPNGPSPEKSLAKSIDYLMSKQGTDGGWHSETYGAMRQGAAVTALVLYALSHAPEELVAPHEERLKRAYKFLEKGIRDKGYVCNPDGTPDYPTYASAMLVTASRRLKLGMPIKDKNRLIDFLISAQLTETRDFGPDSPHYGGWDFSGAQHVRGRTSGTNISLCRFVLEALAKTDDAKAKMAVKLAGKWIPRCQNLPGDGGFFFTPDRDYPSNKALSAKDPTDKTKQRPRSYGTTTCDGLFCLIAVGADPMDKPVVSAVTWLVNRPKVKEVPGFEDLTQSTQWEHSLRYYYYSGLVKALRYFPEQECVKRRKGLIKTILSNQRRDGSWKNEANRMREDDPLICTSLAVIALGELLYPRWGDRR